MQDRTAPGRRDKTAFEDMELLERKPRYDPWRTLATISVLVTWLILA